MKKIVKLFAGVFTVLTLLISAQLPAQAEWKSDSQGYWYTSGSSYLTGWNSIDGNWYYFYSNGYMAHDCWIGNYYLNSNGAWTLDVPSQTSTYSANTYNSNATSTASTTSNNKSQTCYLSATGSKYHRINNCGKMNPNKATQTTVGQAEASGHEPCSKCW